MVETSLPSSGATKPPREATWTQPWRSTGWRCGGAPTTPLRWFRVAHTYAEMGRIDEAGEFYHQAVDQDPDFADQAVSDMVRLARAARDRDDLFGLASAMETAMSFRPGITMQDMALPLARHYFRSGEYATALPYYQASIAGMQGDTIRDVVFEAGSAYDEVGDCRRALLYYEEYRTLIRSYQRGDVDWKIGSCSLHLAQELRSEGEDEEALAHIERTIALGRALEAIRLRPTSRWPRSSRIWAGVKTPWMPTSKSAVSTRRVRAPW